MASTLTERGRTNHLATGVAGALVVLSTHLLLLGLPALSIPQNLFSWIALAAAMVVMALIEALPRRAAALFRSRRELPWPTLSSLVRNHAQLVSLFLAIAMIYVATPEYAFRSPLTLRDSWYYPFAQYFGTISIVILCGAPVYWILTKRPNVPGAWSELANLWLTSRRRKEGASDGFGELRALGVKMFFLPVMVTYYTLASSVFQHTILRLQSSGVTWIQSPSTLYQLLSQAIFLIDLAIASIGYTLTSRLLDSHVRSTDRSWLSWTVTLLCYYPFNIISNRYFSYSGGEWMVLRNRYEAFDAVVVVLAIACEVVYVWSTLSFGIRFSNLTNRGIVSRGPYAWVRHPAYVSKNASWWLLSMPLFESPQAFFGLLGWNALYICRAMFEERHLSSDPEYVAYKKRVPYRFIPRIC